jgi:hypothetical protein
VPIYALVVDAEDRRRLRIAREIGQEFSVLGAEGRHEAAALIIQHAPLVLIVGSELVGGTGSVFLAEAALLAPNAIRILVAPPLEAATFATARSGLRVIASPWRPGALLALVRGLAA